MKILRSIILGASLLLALSLRGQTEIPSTSTDYEELPDLNASEILRDTVLNGPNHKVREEVSTSSGANHFMIDSHVGIFEVEGNEMLVTRIEEINAITRLREVSRTDEFKQALLTAAKSPLNTAKALVTDPVATVSAIPKGLK